MTPTEQRYVQIEKEALALTWACQHFSNYLIGLDFYIQTDHKPLFSTKALEQTILFHNLTFPGKDLLVADTTSIIYTSKLILNIVRMKNV